MDFVQNFLTRREYVEQNKLEAYRLVTQCESAFPWAIDIYKDCAAVHIFGTIPADIFPKLERALRDQFSTKKFFYKNRTKNILELPRSPSCEMVIREYGNSFLVNLSDYSDTGLFLDHRETRRFVASCSRGKTVLNTFAYTGSFTVYAAAGGAEKTYSVDLSRVYCEWIKKNLSLNNLPPEKNWVYKMDTLEFFSYAAKKKLFFDIIIIDPPTFSRNKGKNFSVQHDHPSLIAAALPLLRKGGFILFSNNYAKFRMDAKMRARCHIEEKKDTIPPDFSGTMPHRCFIMRPR